MEACRGGPPTNGRLIQLGEQRFRKVRHRAQMLHCYMVVGQKRWHGSYNTVVCLSEFFPAGTCPFSSPGTVPSSLMFFASRSLSFVLRALPVASVSNFVLKKPFLCCFRNF